MSWSNMCQTLLIVGLLLAGAAFSQVESFEPNLEDYDPLSEKDPMLDPSLTGLGALQSPGVLSSTASLILPPSLPIRRDSKRAIPGGQVEAATSTGGRYRGEWEKSIRDFGSLKDEADLQSPLPARREQAMPQILLPATVPGGIPPMGWNGLSPIAPGQSMILVPAAVPDATILKGPSLPKEAPVSGQSLLGSHDLGAELHRDTSTDPSKPISSRLSSQKTKDSQRGKESPVAKSKEKPLSMEALGGEVQIPMLSPSRTALGNTPSSRLRSQALSSSGGGLASQSRTSSTALRSSSASGSSSAQTPTLPSKRFHGGTPGEPRRPDYTYQYQGTRRYSVGETEYGRGSAYESLPYYRRRR